MIDFFLGNESIINILSMSTMLATLIITSGFEDDEPYNKIYRSFMYLVFVASFSIVVLSVAVNGSIKGFN